MDRYIDRLYYDAIVKIIRTENPLLPPGKTMRNHCLHRGYCKSAWVCVLAKKNEPIQPRRLGSRGVGGSNFAGFAPSFAHLFICACMHLGACSCVAVCIPVSFCDDYWNKKQKYSTLNFFHYFIYWGCTQMRQCEPGSLKQSISSSLTI